jgi:hypothetical protein
MTVSEVYEQLSVFIIYLTARSLNHRPLQLVKLQLKEMYCSIFALSKNCGARETAVASERL